MAPVPSEFGRPPRLSVPSHHSARERWHTLRASTQKNAFALSSPEEAHPQFWAAARSPHPRSWPWPLPWACRPGRWAAARPAAAPHRRQESPGAVMSNARRGCLRLQRCGRRSGTGRGVCSRGCNRGGRRTCTRSASTACAPAWRQLRPPQPTRRPTPHVEAPRARWQVVPARRWRGPHQRGACRRARRAARP